MRGRHPAGRIPNEPDPQDPPDANLQAMVSWTVSPALMPVTVPCWELIRAVGWVMTGAQAPPRLTYRLPSASMPCIPSAALTACSRSRELR